MQTAPIPVIPLLLQQKIDQILKAFFIPYFTNLLVVNFSRLNGYTTRKDINRIVVCIYGWWVFMVSNSIAQTVPNRLTTGLSHAKTLSIIPLTLLRGLSSCRSRRQPSAHSALCSDPAEGHNAHLIANLHLQRYVLRVMTAMWDWKPHGDRKKKRNEMGGKKYRETPHIDDMMFVAKLKHYLDK